MVVCFAGVIVIVCNSQETHEMYDATSGAMDLSLEEEEQVESETSMPGRNFGILLILVAAATTAGTAVFNRSLKSVDYVVVMTYHGLFGFIVAILLLTVNFFCTDSKIESLELGLSDCAMLTFGVLVDAASVFGQTVAF